MTDLYDIKILTLFEYEARMYSFSLSEVDKERDMHLQAWINHQVTGTKEQGKKTLPLYKSFKEFFDYEERIAEVEGESPKKELEERYKRMARIAKKSNEKG